MFDSGKFCAGVDALGQKVDEIETIVEFVSEAIGEIDPDAAQVKFSAGDFNWDYYPPLRGRKGILRCFAKSVSPGKERSENIMLMDLERKDFRLSVEYIGTVRAHMDEVVEELCKIYPKLRLKLVPYLVAGEPPPKE